MKLVKLNSWGRKEVIHESDGTESIKELLLDAIAHNICLCYVDLKGADLSGVDLRDVDLREADLRDADLSSANLSGVNLSGATLKDTKF